MSGLDRWRLIVAVVLSVLGVAIVLRALTSGAYPIAIVGLLLIGLGIYRVNQFRRYFATTHSR